jgi:hypothetical protein
VVLFLDFDGVLHPDPCPPQRLFEHAPRLAATLAEFPATGVVLSTSWRTFLTHAQLLALLPDALRNHVLGVTPRFGEFPAPPALAPYRRHAECVQWVRAHGVDEAAWLALDDRPSWFAPYCEHLIACDSRLGFDDDAAARLRFALARARARLARRIDALV